MPFFDTAMALRSTSATRNPPMTGSTRIRLGPLTPSITDECAAPHVPPFFQGLRLGWRKRLIFIYSFGVSFSPFKRG